MHQQKKLTDFVNGTGTYLAYVALKKDDVIGTISHGRLSEPIQEAVDQGKIPEPDTALLTTYVHPDFQRQGIGKFLVENVINELQSKGLKSFALDSSYQSGIAFWTKILGRQTLILEKYYENNYDCYIWYKEIL